ncbi:MAG: EamA family transporter, partial [Actinomycetota bacterium]|nr:EamA family transporter [Actinomycetota bacterium]
EQTVPSGLAALLVAATPLWLVCLRLAAGDRPRRLSLAGVLLGFVGVALLARPGGGGGNAATWGLLMILAASACWALGSFLSARLPLPADPLVATTYEMLLGGGLQLVLGAAVGELRGFDPGAVSGRSWAAWGYLVVVGSLVAFSAYVWLLGNAPISLTATYAYVNPVVAVLLGALLLDEAVTAAIVAGGAVVVAGVALVVTAERPRRRDPAAEEELSPVR